MSTTPDKEKAFQAHLAQFEALREEISLSSGLQYDMINYSIAIVAGAVAVVTLEGNSGQAFISENPITLLIISMMMSLMAWASLEAEYRIHDFRHYVHSTLSRKVQNLIANGSSKLSEEYIVWHAEMADIAKEAKLRTGIRAMFVSAKFMIIFVPALASLIVFIAEAPPLVDWRWYEAALFILASLLAACVPLGLIVHLRFVSSYYLEEEAE